MLQTLKGLGTSFSFRELLDRLMETSASNEKIERFLQADITGQGSIRDIVTARMTNELAQRMGQATDMNSSKVKWIREAEQKNPIPNDLPGAINPYRR
jgi:macrodomain Ter protein organizer (MatP/YcbG family)